MMKTNRSTHSTKSLPHATDAAFEMENPAPAFNFEDLLCNTCFKFNCPYPIIVRKEYRQDAYLKLLKHSERNQYKKINLKVPMIESSSVKVLKKIAEMEADADEKLTDYDKVTIIVTSIYDSMNRLIKLAINKAQDIPRVLIQSIRLLAPNFVMLNNITLTRCGIDGLTLYELSHMLPKTNITEICLDQSPVPEGNYALLLTLPSRLKNLSLCRCRINDAVVRQLAARLHHPLPAAQTLQLLNLASNDVTDEGARLLAAALRSNRHLRYLNLSDNNITDTGACYIFNVLKEFPLTSEELLEKRNRYLDYLMTRMEFCIKFMYDFGVKAFDEISLSSNSPYGRKSHTKRSTSSPKHNKIIKHKSSQSVPHLPVTSSQFLKNRAESLAGETLGPFIDPYTTTHVTVKDEWPYCHGNFTLSFLNLAYNSLSFMAIKYIYELVHYQSGMMNLHETGLLKIIIEGNPLPEKIEQLEAITLMLQKNMSRYMGAGKTPDKRKSRFTASAGASSIRTK